MLNVISKAGDLDIAQLKAVYAGSLEAQEDTPGYDRLRELEDAFYQDTYSFLRQPDSCYCVWVLENTYVSAVRIEKYLDGFLLCGLETAPKLRCRGYAKALVCAVSDYLAGGACMSLYSHVAADNASSLAVHRNCGFQKIKDSAVFLDGSVSSEFVTLYKRIK